MTVLEKIKRCVSLVWDFKKYMVKKILKIFCHNELSTYPQHDEIMEYFKRIEALEKEIAEFQDKLKNLASIAEVRLANWQRYEQENAKLKEKLEKIKDYLAYKIPHELINEATTIIYKML